MMQATSIERRSDAPEVGPGVETTAIGVLGGATLDRWLAGPWDRGVQVDELEQMHVLRVRTRNSSYELAIAEGVPGEVLVRGGRYFPEWTRVHLAGSSLGGGLLKQYGVHIGFRLEFYWNRRRIVTSPVQSIGCVPATPMAEAC